MNKNEEINNKEIDNSSKDKRDNLNKNFVNIVDNKYENSNFDHNRKKKMEKC